MAALLTRGDAVGDSEEVEVMACRKSHELIVDAGFTKVILEGDNAMVLKTISQAQPNFSRLRLIYEDIWCLAAGFRSIWLTMLGVVQIVLLMLWLDLLN